MILSILSTNPELSYLLCKNPNKPRIIPIRKGQSIGFYPFPHEFRITFIDAPDEISYPEYQDQEFEFLSLGKFNSPMCALNLISSWCTLQTKYDGVHENTIIIQHLRIKDKIFKIIQKHYPEINLEVVCDKNYMLVYKAKDTLVNMLQKLQLILTMIAIDNGETYFDKSFLQKMFRLINVTNAPYFVRYVLKSAARPWKEYCHLFQNDRMKIEAEDNFSRRKKYVGEHLDSTDIIDIGCGEGRYFTKDVNIYHGVEINDETRALAKRRADIKKFDNVVLYSNIEEVSVTDPVNIICTEVIEHVPLSDLSHLFKQIKRIAFKKLIFTTPNRDFNQFYGVETRHEDHKWECSKQEFEQLMNKHFSKYRIEYSDLGDCVDGIHTTLGAVIYDK